MPHKSHITLRCTGIMYEGREVSNKENAVWVGMRIEGSVMGKPHLKENNRSRVLLFVVISYVHFLCLLSIFMAYYFYN